MNLVIIAPRLTLDDPPLAFIPNRIAKIASKIEKLWLITPRAQKIEFPNNVIVVEVGRDFSRKEKVVHALQNFHYSLWEILRKEDIDGIFTYMYPEFAILASPYAKLRKIKLIMWYAHYQIDWKLILASTLVDKILTTSYETCKIRKDKVYPIGQGIDIDTFHIYPEQRSPSIKHTINIVSVGRISPVKHLEIIIDAANILINQYSYKDLHFSFVGTPPNKQHLNYQKFLEIRISNYGLLEKISFIGNIDHHQLPMFYQSCDLFVSSSLGVDKAIFEAMACEIPVIVSHPVFKEILKPYANELIYKYNDVQDLVNKLRYVISLSYEKRRFLGQSLRDIVLADHSLEQHINRIISAFNE